MSDPRVVTPEGVPTEMTGTRTGAQFTSLEYVRWIAEEHATIAASVINLPTIPAAANYAYVQVKLAPIYWTFLNQVTPSSSAGQEVALGGYIYLRTREEIVNFRAVRQASVSATLKVLYGVKVVNDVG